MALVFPATPAVGEKYPADPGTSGVTQYIYTGTKWNVVTSGVSLGPANQAAFNDYTWPASDGTAGYQLQTDGAGNLTWELESNNSIQALGVTPNIDGVSTVYTLVEYGTSVFFTPTPSTNIIVFLGGVPQSPVVSYNVTGNQITFTGVPPAGTSFYAITNVIV